MRNKLHFLEDVTLDGANYAATKWYDNVPESHAVSALGAGTALAVYSADCGCMLSVEGEAVAVKGDWCVESHPPIGG